jgi:hypothetical protein
VDRYYSILFKEQEVSQDIKKEILTLGGEITNEPGIGFIQVKSSKNILHELQNLSGLESVSPSIPWSIPQSQNINEKIFNDALVTKGSLWNKQWDIKRIHK